MFGHHWKVATTLPNEEKTLKHFNFLKLVKLMNYLQNHFDGIAIP